MQTAWRAGKIFFRFFLQKQEFPTQPVLFHPEKLPSFLHTSCSVYYCSSWFHASSLSLVTPALPLQPYVRGSPVNRATASERSDCGLGLSETQAMARLQTPGIFPSFLSSCFCLKTQKLGFEILPCPPVVRFVEALQSTAEEGEAAFILLGYTCVSQLSRRVCFQLASGT